MPKPTMVAITSVSPMVLAWSPPRRMRAARLPLSCSPSGLRRLRKGDGMVGLARMAGHSRDTAPRGRHDLGERRDPRARRIGKTGLHPERDLVHHGDLGGARVQDLRALVRHVADFFVSNQR